MTIRPLTADDVGVYRTIRLRALATDPEAFASTHGRESGFDDDTWSARIAGWDGRPGQILVEETDVGGEPAGVVGIGWSGRPGDVVLWGMWVAPEARGCGVGRRLADAAISWAREQGAETVTLWLMRSNPAAHRLYTQCGFVEQADAGEGAPEGCSDELRMLLVLDDAAARPTQA